LKPLSGTFIQQFILTNELVGPTSAL